jgi:hypothetical protein
LEKIPKPIHSRCNKRKSHRQSNKTKLQFLKSQSHRTVAEFHDVNTSRGDKKSTKPTSETRTPPSNQKNKNTTQTNTSSSQKEEQRKATYEDFLLFLATKSAEPEITEDLRVTKSSRSRRPHCISGQFHYSVIKYSTVALKIALKSISKL